MTVTRNGSPNRWPDFIHVGPPRTGTTWLHEVLIGHCGLPSIKETHFFDSDYGHGAEWYLGLFQSPDPSLPMGEIAPTYFSNHVARERIKKHIPDSKIICTFRDPTERLYSLYRLARKKRLPVYDTFEKYWRAIVDSGSDVATYATQLRRWQDTFGDDNLLVLFYEDLAADPQGYLNRVCDFIGIPRFSIDQSPVGDSPVFTAPTAAKSNALARRTVVAIDWIGKHGGAKLVQMGNGTRLRKTIRDLFVVDFETLDSASADELRALMLPETEELERVTGRDLSNWKPAAERGKNSRAARIQLSS
jgi:LPS sulfotransferase NodH